MILDRVGRMLSASPRLPLPTHVIMGTTAWYFLAKELMEAMDIETISPTETPPPGAVEIRGLKVIVSIHVDPMALQLV